MQNNYLVHINIHKDSYDYAELHIRVLTHSMWPSDIGFTFLWTTVAAIESHLEDLWHLHNSADTRVLVDIAAGRHLQPSRTDRKEFTRYTEYK